MITLKDGTRITGTVEIGGTQVLIKTNGDAQVIVATTDTNAHTHTVTVDMAALDATTAQTLTTSSAGQPPGHTHMITLTPANLAALRGGGMVDVLSTNVDNHTHTYRITCT